MPFSWLASGEPLRADFFEESLDNTVKVSGRFYLGAQIPAAYDGDVSVYLPSRLDGVLHLELASVDGRYKAKAVRDITGSEKGWLDIEYPSSYENALEEYAFHDLAINAYVVMRESGRISLVSSWAEDVGDQKPVLMIRSSARKDTVFMKGEKISKCRKLASAYVVTYDKYCELSVSSYKELSALTVVRKNLQKMPDEILYFGAESYVESP